jgi:hypothetical protein
MDRPLPLFLRPAYRQALAKRARELNMGEAEAAAHLLSAALAPFLGQDPADEQAKAEKQLLQIIDELTAAELAKPGWNEHLTAAVFQAIADHYADLYERATINGERNRINRLIGSRVKAVAGADVKLAAGKPVVGQLPRSSGALIRRYTLLVPRRSAGTGKS